MSIIETDEQGNKKETLLTKLSWNNKIGGGTAEIELIKHTDAKGNIRYEERLINYTNKPEIRRYLADYFLINKRD